MDVYLLNGTSRVQPVNGSNQVWPINGTNQTRPMNIAPIVIAAASAAAQAAIKIYAAKQAKKKSAAQAHSEFMAAVYGMPGISKKQEVMLHQLAEHDMGEAVKWVENYVADYIAKEEQKLATEAAVKASRAAYNADPSIAMRNGAMAIQTTANYVDQIIDGGPLYIPTADEIAAEVVSNQPNKFLQKSGGISGWWAARSTGQKVAIVGGGAVVIGGIIYLATRKKKRPAARRRSSNSKKSKR